MKAVAANEDAVPFCEAVGIEEARRIRASVNILLGYRIETLEAFLRKANGTDTYLELIIDGELQ